MIASKNRVDPDNQVSSKRYYVLDFLLALGICFMVPISQISPAFQQYIIIAPTLFLLVLKVFVIQKNGVHRGVLLVAYLIVLSWFIAGYKFGITSSDAVSLLGVLLIPIIVQVYIHRDSRPIITYFVAIFSLYELVLLYYSYHYHAWLNVYSNIILQQLVAWSYPNYFAMLAAVKMALAVHLSATGALSTKMRNVLCALSLFVIMNSLSRTAMIMTVIIVFVPLFFSQKANLSPGKRFFRKVRLLVLLGGLVYISRYLFTAKDQFAGAVVDHTLNQRYDIWDNVLAVFRENYLIGIGFRSTTEFVADISSAHNDYMDFLVKGGVIMFVVLYAFFAKRLVLLFSDKKIMQACVVLSIFAAGMTQNPLKFFPTMCIFCLMLAESYKRKKDSSPSVDSGAVTG